MDIKKACLELFLKNCVANYLKFTGEEKFPNYQLIPKRLTTSKADSQGFDSMAATYYDLKTGSHRLEVWEDAYLPQLNAKYLIFHEFTHIMDAEKYSQKDKIKHMSNKGYTEYHAAQIDFLQLLGADNTQSAFAFSMKDTFETIGGTKTAKQFLEMPHSHASALIERSDFPANLETLAVTLGLIFNYYGRRSICKMYASDYSESVDNSSIAKLIREDTVQALNAYMLGWFDDSKVAMLDMLYYKMVISLANKYHL